MMLITDNYDQLIFCSKSLSKFVTAIMNEAIHEHVDHLSNYDVIKMKFEVRS